MRVTFYMEKCLKGSLLDQDYFNFDAVAIKGKSNAEVKKMLISLYPLNSITGITEENIVFKDVNEENNKNKAGK